MTEAEKERAAIVAWLRRGLSVRRQREMPALATSIIRKLTDSIECLDHLKSEGHEG